MEFLTRESSPIFHDFSCPKFGAALALLLDFSLTMSRYTYVADYFLFAYNYLWSYRVISCASFDRHNFHRYETEKAVFLRVRPVTGLNKLK